MNIRQKMMERYHPMSQKMSRMKVSNNIVLVAAIDFGTTYSGYAFSFRHEYERDPMKIHTNTWGDSTGSGTGATLKTPTCLLLRPDKKFHSFGYDARSKYEDLIIENKHHDWYYFLQFKMSLHQQKEIKSTYRIQEENGKELEAVQVFAASIEYLKTHLVEAVNNSGPQLLPHEFMWVITVPAIWQESAKKFMRKAAEMAGINGSNLSIALEPEAASLYCRKLPMVRDHRGEIGPFTVGSKYLILDCGGGTVDITVHELLRGNRLKEIHKATGGHWGGTKVDKAFLQFIEAYTGPAAFENFKRDSKVDYLNLLQDFEAKKKNVKPGSSELVTIRIPQSLQSLLVRQPSPPNYPGKVTLLGDKIRIEPQLFEYFFETPIQDVLQHVEELLRRLQIPITAILMVGGFAESPLLQHAVKSRFGPQPKVVIPIDPSLCVMKGAILFGHAPTEVTERELRYTYGVAMNVPFDKQVYPRNRRIEIDGELLCHNVFDKHAEVGETVRVNEPQPEREYFPLADRDTVVSIVLFRSTSRNPKFVDEDGCDCVGQFDVKIKDHPQMRGKYDKKILVRLVFGGTEITAEVVERGGEVHTTDFKLVD